MDQHDLRALRDALAGDPQLIDRWMQELLRRSWTLRHVLDLSDRPGAGSTTSETRAGTATDKLPLALLRERCACFLTGLQEALASATSLEVGTPELREPVQLLSFVAGWMAGRGLAITDAVALVHSLEAVLGGPSPFYQALVMVVSEAHSAALVQRAQARYRDAMEKSQLVCALHPQLPCLFLVGDPDRQALDEALGRLMMLALMRDAHAILVDGTGLFQPEILLPLLIQRLGDRQPRSLQHTCISGAPAALALELGPTLPAGISLHEQLPAALAAAAPYCGQSWIID